MNDVFDKITSRIKEVSENKALVIVGIDGNCASGKTTLAAMLEKELDAQIIHMDDFFLPPEMRTQERLLQPGGNVHYERFVDEVVKGLKSEIAFKYRVFSCSQGGFSGEKSITPKGIVIVEGSYSLHPKFSDLYDVKIFSEVSYEKQLERIEKRNGTKALDAFKEKWIPLENKYFSAFKIKEGCDILHSTD